PAALVGERDPLAHRCRVDGETHRQRPRQAVREPHLRDDPLVVVAAQEAFERRERAGSDHVQVGQLARGQREHLERLDVVRPRAAHSSTEAETNTSTNVPYCSTSARAFCRVSSYGEIAAVITAPPCRVSREATQPMRSMFVSRSSFEKPRPFDSRVRTVSPSRYSTTSPRRPSSGPTRWAIVVL